MITGLYASASCLLNAGKEVELISTNLANISTPAYKQDRVAYRSFPDFLLKVARENGAGSESLGKLGGGCLPDPQETCFDIGDIQRTGNPHDLAIDGEGFFQVLTNQGVHYTRNGGFHQDAEGYLRDSADNPIVGSNGVIRIGDPEFRIEGDGRIIVETEVAGVMQEKIVGQIELVDFEDKGLLERAGGSLFAMPREHQGTMRKATGTIRQSFLEDSNITTSQGIIQLISAFRSYEASTKMLEAIDETFQKSVSQVADAKA